jgi:serine/threonine protein kinase
MAAAHEERVVRARAKVGSVLNDKYRLDRVLGVGGMAAVFSATHLRNASRIAVKLLHPEMAADSNIRARFLREGYAANTVAHPGTVRILDDDSTEDGAVFLVMELLEGETLDQRWERSGHKLGAREVARLLYQVLDVLAAAHANGIVHRDIKPENLFLTRAGILKVLDFGVARLIEAPMTTTRPGGIVGTPAFMAPEQVLGKTVDAQSDLYSVGATAFALLSKRYVHDAENAAEMMVVVGSKPARSLALVCPELPSPLAAVVDRSLLFNKADRWPDARSMQMALARAYREAFSSPMPGAEDVEDETAIVGTPMGASIAPRIRVSDRASAAVTVLTGATPVTTHSIEPPRKGTPTTRILRWRPSVVAGTGAIVTLLIGVVLAMTAGGPSSGSATTGQQINAPATSLHDHTTDNSSAWSTPGATKSINRITADPPSFPVESLPAVGQAPATPSTNAVAGGAPAPSPPRAASPRPTSACTPPFTLDPATGKKKWKLECL